MKTQRRTARLLVLLGFATALVTSGVAARWWARWPEDTAERLFRLVEQGEFDKANLLLAPPAEWTDLSPDEVAEAVAQSRYLTGIPIPPSKKLHDSNGEVLDLSVVEWQSLFKSEKFTARSRTTQDYLQARRIVEAELPDARPFEQGYTSWRVVLTVEGGRVSVRLIHGAIINVYF